MHDDDDSILPGYIAVVPFTGCAQLTHAHTSLLAEWSCPSDLHDWSTSAWRPAHLTTSDHPPLVPTMPRHQAAVDAHAAEQRRRAAGPAYTSYLGALETLLRAQSYDVQASTRGIHRWRYLLAQKPNDTRIEVHLQPPEQAGRWLLRLWCAGMRIDGFDLVKAGCILHTTIRDLEQMTLVRDMVGWITGYIAVSPVLGVPPPPYRLVAAHGLCEQIRAIDSVSLPTAN